MIEAYWLLFTIASLALIVTPGQEMVLVMSRAVAQGAAAGVVTLVKGRSATSRAGFQAGCARGPALSSGCTRTSGAVFVALGVKLAFERRA